MPDSPRTGPRAQVGGQSAHFEATRNSIEFVPRRLRRSAQDPPRDGAGLLNSTKDVPRAAKGKGTPPADDREWSFRCSKVFVESASFKSSMSNVLAHAGINEQQASTARTALRLSDRSYMTNLTGGSVAVTADLPMHKPQRRPGTAAPAYRTERVFGMVPTSEEAQPTYALMSTARRDVFVSSSRPTTAPSCLLVTKTQARTGYDLSRSAYDDVLNYRHSGGICPAEFKLSSERAAAPQRSNPSANAQSKTGFFDTRGSYQANRLRGHMSDIMMGR